MWVESARSAVQVSCRRHQADAWRPSWPRRQRRAGQLRWWEWADLCAVSALLVVLGTVLVIFLGTVLLAILTVAGIMLATHGKVTPAAQLFAKYEDLDNLDWQTAATCIWLCGPYPWLFIS